VDKLFYGKRRLESRKSKGIPWERGVSGQIIEKEDIMAVAQLLWEKANGNLPRISPDKSAKACIQTKWAQFPFPRSPLHSGQSALTLQVLSNQANSANSI
jgi:hypothetical protein